MMMVDSQSVVSIIEVMIVGQMSNACKTHHLLFFLLYFLISTISNQIFVDVIFK